MNNKSSEITIVYIEDSDDVRFACEQTLTLAGYRVISCCDAEHSIPLIQSQANIIILTDVRLPGISGLELLSYINEMDSKIPVILITGHGDVEMAVDAMRNGAFDFIEKPSSSDKLLSIIARAVEKRRLVLENQQLLANLQQENGPVLIGRSPQMQQSLMSQIPVPMSLFMVKQVVVKKSSPECCITGVPAVRGSLLP